MSDVSDVDDAKRVIGAAVGSFGRVDGLTLLNVPPFWVQFVQGVVIFLAVLVDALNRRREGRAG